MRLLFDNGCSHSTHRHIYTDIGLFEVMLWSGLWHTFLRRRHSIGRVFHMGPHGVSIGTAFFIMSIFYVFITCPYLLYGHDFFWFYFISYVIFVSMNVLIYMVSIVIRWHLTYVVHSSLIQTYIAQSIRLVLDLSRVFCYTCFTCFSCGGMTCIIIIFCI